jgi:hemerythrin superfamily protein
MAATTAAKTRHSGVKTAAGSKGNGAGRGRTRSGSSPDAIAVLKADHRDVETLFKAFEQAGATAYRTKRKLVDQLIVALSQHAAIEEEELYPAARQQQPESTDEVLEALEEHHVVKWQLQELVGMDPKDERFDAKVTVLTENVRHHVKEEEGELFPTLRRAMSRAQLVELGSRLEQARAFAPTRPHPRSPDEPPTAKVGDTVAGVIDHARDVVRAVRH